MFHVDDLIETGAKKIIVPPFRHGVPAAPVAATRRRCMAPLALDLPENRPRIAPADRVLWACLARCPSRKLTLRPRVRFRDGQPQISPSGGIGILTKVADKPVDAYLKKTLFGPLMIRDWNWDRDKAGHTITYAQLYMTARDLARLGKFTIDKPNSAFAKPGPEKHRGLIWRLYQDPKGHGHTGWLGQFLVVYPKHQLVGVRLRRVKNGTLFDNRAHEFGAFASLLGDLVR